MWWPLAVSTVSSAITVNNGALVTTDTSGPYTFKVNFNRQPSGAHALWAKARDAAGNVGVSPMVTVYKYSAGRKQGVSARRLRPASRG